MSIKNCVMAQCIMYSNIVTHGTQHFDDKETLNLQDKTILRNRIGN